MENKYIIERRKKLFSNLDDFSLVILFSGRSKKCSADALYDFCCNRNFYYLTQVDQEDSIYLGVKTPEGIKEYIFVQTYDEVKEKWTGIRLRTNEVENLSGISNVLYNECAKSKIQMIIEELLNLKENLKIYIDLEKELKIEESYTTTELKEDILQNYPSIEVNDIYLNIVRLRMVKTHEEILLFEEAIKTTHVGINAILSKIKPGLKEYQLVSTFEHSIRDYNNSFVSFPTIAAAGKNATILHYPNPTGSLNDHELMLFDLGSRYEYYCADVSRTFPIGGKYEGKCELVYDIVLGCNKHIINIIEPGITIKELQAEAVAYLTKKCLEAGLIEKEEDIIKYYFHGVSHHIGLDTHDPSLRELPLEEGNIISVEPGLYIKELGIGIRIEDDILVTKDGSMTLTHDIPKEKSDIEKLIATRGQMYE